VRERDKGKQQAIREKALEMFLSDGFDGFSMQKLARAAKVSPGTLYIYYKDRDDLILSLYREESEKMAEASLEGFSSGMNFGEGLRLQWRNRAGYYMQNPAASHFLEQVRFTPYHERAFQKEKTGSNQSLSFGKIMQAFVKNSIQNGELEQIPIEVFWSVAYAPLYNLLKYHQHGYSFPGFKEFKLDEKTLETTLQLVLRALTPQNKGKI
jgi:AcrR family transcriptional regulator